LVVQGFLLIVLVCLYLLLVFLWHFSFCFNTPHLLTISQRIFKPNELLEELRLIAESVSFNFLALPLKR
jgi:hypothetical protein